MRCQTFFGESTSSRREVSGFWKAERMQAQQPHQPVREQRADVKNCQYHCDPDSNTHNIH